MATVSFPVRALLATSTVSVGALLRMAVAVDAEGGHLQPEVTVTMHSPWHPVPQQVVRAVELPDGVLVDPHSAPGSLRAAFDEAHPRTAALLADLSARSEQFLAGLRMGEDPAEVVLFGQALEVVHRELAGADRMRREWVARQAHDVRAVQLQIAQRDLLHLDTCPPTLPAGLDIPAGPSRELADGYGVLLALVAGAGMEDGAQDDAPAGLAVYRRPPLTPIAEAAVPPAGWVRDDALTRDHLPSAPGPDGAPGVPASAHSLDAGRAPAHPDAGGLAAAQCQLDLLDASDEYARLASTHERLAELSALEQQSRLARIPQPRAAQ